MPERLRHSFVRNVRNFPVMRLKRDHGQWNKAAKRMFSYFLLLFNFASAIQPSFSSVIDTGTPNAASNTARREKENPKKTIVMRDAYLIL